MSSFGGTAAATVATVFLPPISAVTMAQDARSASTAFALWRLAGYRVSSTAVSPEIYIRKFTCTTSCVIAISALPIAFRFKRPGKRIDRSQESRPVQRKKQMLTELGGFFPLFPRHQPSLPFDGAT